MSFLLLGAGLCRSGCPVNHICGQEARKEGVFAGLTCALASGEHMLFREARIIWQRDPFPPRSAILGGRLYSFNRNKSIMCGIRKRFFPLDNLHILFFFDVPISQWRFLRILVHPSKYWRAIMCPNLVIYFHRLLYHRQNSPWSRIPHWLCAFSLRRPLLTCFNLGIYFNSNRTTPRRRGPSTQRGSRSRSRHPP